ncbi:MAG: acyltransferase, partial [Microvirga sp.]
ALLTPTRVATPFRHCGRHSIAIYLAFFLPMAATRAVLLKSGLIDDVGLVSAIVTAVAVVAPLILERLVRETPLSFLFRRPAAFHIAPARAPRLQPAE